MKAELQRYTQLISKSIPGELEQLLRRLVVHYFFHVSNKRNIEITAENSGTPNTLNVQTPCVFKGQGHFKLAATAVFGWIDSPGSYTCSHFEAKTADSLIEVGENTAINNRAALISQGASIRIGKRCNIGPEVYILDSNGHELAVNRRGFPDNRPKPVIIEDDVFIGARVTILKGAQIGRGSVVAAGSIIPPNFVAPEHSIIAGNPAAIVGKVSETDSNS